MSKAAKQSIFVLLFLLLGSLGFAGYMVFVEKPKLEGINKNLTTDLAKTQKSEKQFAEKAKSFEQQAQDALAKSNTLQEQLKTKETEIQQIQEQVRVAEEEKEKFKKRFETANETREQLLSKIDELEKEIVSFKEGKTVVAQPVAETDGTTDVAVEGETDEFAASTTPAVVDEEYWAGLLKEKTSLQQKLTSLQEELSNKSVQIVELQQENADFQIQIDQMRSEKEQLSRNIKHKEDMVDNLALELARTKNERKFVADRVDQLNADNQELRGEIKKLVMAKGALEKSIVNLTQDKDKIEKQLGKTENIIQSKIDEIWEIKESLDKTIQTSKDTAASTSSVELSPIVVNSQEQEAAFDTGMAKQGYEGKVVSVNESNNFVIVDIGQGEGINIGEQLSVYRDAKYIARLEVIQVRSDISAADIKEQWAKIKEGDVVR